MRHSFQKIYSSSSSSTTPFLLISLLLFLQLIHFSSPATTCFGRDSGDANVCSRHGTCSATDTCDCATNYFGEDCSITLCDGIYSNETSTVCSGRGKCFPYETCTCTEGYKGDSCEYVFCNNINATDPNVCNGRGTCQNTRICSCDTGYSGTYCQFTTCDGISSKNPQVCSGHGTCVNVDNCTCAETYSGTYCDVYQCFGIPSGDSSVCSSHGTCTATDTCSCAAGFAGPTCNVSICYGVEQSDPAVCSGHGTCLNANQCQCEDGYGSPNCQYAFCAGTLANETSTVCSGHGDCLLPDTCDCATGYYGSKCEDFYCFCENRASSQVCSSHGLCSSANNCTCSGTYFGDDCEHATCFDIKSTDSENVCSGHGNCVSTDTCTCNVGYSGSKCQHPVCYGKSLGYSGTDAVVCSGKGSCTAPDTCECTGKFRNEDCSVPYCFNEWHPDKVCSGSGTCSSPDTCTCDSTHEGSKCQFRKNFILDRQNTTSRNIKNMDEYITTPISLNTDKFSLFGKTYNKVRLSSNGFMSFGDGTYKKTKTTFSEYTASDAVIFMGHADLDMRGSTPYYNKIYYRQALRPPTTAQRTELATIKSLVQNHFYTHPKYSTFDPDWFWVTSMDGVGYYPKKVDPLNFVQVILAVSSTQDMSFVIFNTRFRGIQHPSTSPIIGLVPPYGVNASSPYVDSMNVADPTSRQSAQYAQQSNVGTPGLYIYPTHEAIVTQKYTYTHTCFGVNATDDSVCSSHGKCTGKNICECDKKYKGDKCEIHCEDETLWEGDYCQVPKCFGVAAYKTNSVCSGHGSCTAPDTCSCTSPYSGSDCSLYSCYGKLKTADTVCSGHGTCSAPDSCTCNPGYQHGGTNECQSFTCESACAHGGTCTSPNRCTGCNSPYFGDTCEEAYRYVSQTTGDDQGGANTCLTRSSPCRTIIHAISQAGFKNIITLLDGGVWKLPLHTVLISQSLVFMGEEGHTTILESQQEHNADIPHFGILYQLNGHSVEFRHLTLRNIRSNVFLSVKCTHGSKAILNTVNVDGNSTKRIVEYTGAARLEVTNSTFTDFSLTPLYVRALEKSTGDYVTVSDSRFVNIVPATAETTTLNGAALHVQNVASVSLSTTSFSKINSTAVVLMNADAISLTNCSFTNGVSTQKSEFASALVIDTATTVSSSSLHCEQHTVKGAVVRMSNVGTLSMSDARFTHNQAQSGTTGLDLIHVSSYECSSCTFAHNIARLGGAARLNNAHGKFIGSTFSNNTAYEGSAVYGTDSSVAAQDSVFMKNHASQAIEFLSGIGSVISVGGSSFVSTSGTQFYSNHGCITLKDKSYFSLVDSQFSNHIYGTILSLNNNPTKSSLIHGCSFVNNDNSGGFGGCITNFAFGGPGLTISNSSFRTGSAYNGGAIASVDQSSLTIEGTTFQNFSAASSGGALYLEQVNETVIHSTSVQSNSAEFGGGLFAKEVLKSRFFVRMDGLKVSNSNFTGNRASGDGGAVALSTENIFVCTECHFLDNVAAKSGGAIHADGVAYQSSFEDASKSFETIVAESSFGDLLHVDEAAGLVLTRCTLDQNHADIGGSITTFSNGIRLKLDHTNITRSSATSDGGSVYIFVRHSEISHSHISSSRAMRGGCIFALLSVESLQFVNSEFSECSADDAAIYLSTDTVLYFTNSILRSSVTVTGGILSSANMFVENSQFYDNRASDYGSSIAILNNGALSVSNSVFRRNYAASKGGIIYSSSYDQMTFTGVTSVGNEAALGGTVYFDIPVNTEIDAPIVRAISIDATSLLEDHATVAGGAFFSNKKGHMALDTSLSNVQPNISSNAYGSVFASEPTTLKTSYIETLVNPLTDELQPDVRYNFTSSQVFVVFPGQYFDAVIEVLDHYKQIVSQFPELTVKATANGAQLIGASLEELITDRKVTFSQLQLYGQYGATATITFSASGVTGIPSVTYGVKFVSCPRGYRYVSAASTGDSIDRCELCPRGAYTLRPFQTDCVYTCPNFECEASTINAENGFWIDVGGDGQIRAVPCPNGKCNGGQLELFTSDEEDDVYGSSPIPDGFSTLASVDAGAQMTNLMPISLTEEETLVLSDANFTSLIPNSLREVKSFRGSICDDNRVGILCAQCLPGFSEWRGSCLRCETGSAALTLALLAYCAIIIAYVHYSSQNEKVGASVKILISFSQTVFHTINFPAWVRKQEQKTVNVVFTIFTTIISLFNLEIPSLSNTATSGLNCPFDRPGYWYYSGQLLQHLLTILVIVLALLLSLCFLAASALLSGSKKKKSTEDSEAERDSVSNLDDLGKLEKSKEDEDTKQQGLNNDVDSNGQQTEGLSDGETNTVNSSEQENKLERYRAENSQQLGEEHRSKQDSAQHNKSVASLSSESEQPLTDTELLKRHNQDNGAAPFGADNDPDYVEDLPATDAQTSDKRPSKAKRFMSALATRLRMYTTPWSFVRSLINMLIFTYQPIVDITFTFFFGCFTTGGGVSVFIEKSDLPCWTTGAYWGWAVFYLPVLAYILFFPLVMVAFLRLNKKHLENPNFKRYFGPLYDIYKPKYYWFEWVNFARRASLIGGGVIANSLILAQGVTGIQFVVYSVILSLNYVTVHITNPFLNHSDNIAEKYSLFVTLFMLSIQEGTSDISESVGVVFAMIVTSVSLVILIVYVVRENWLVKKIRSKLGNALASLNPRRKRKGKGDKAHVSQTPTTSMLDTSRNSLDKMDEEEEEEKDFSDKVMEEMPTQRGAALFVPPSEREQDKNDDE